ncbi:tubulin-like doman-containing protein [Vibrio metschnikovii]|nr:tubulin-like doman-containing protein [Vibrio metschnikovii]
MLIGIGGIGSRYVDALYGRLSEEQRDRVAIHAIDTDINDISRLQHIGQDRCSQIGARGTVGAYLHELKRSDAATTVERWFPPKVREDQTITNGAGQIRAVARLALHASLRCGGLPNLRNQLTQLFKVREDGRFTTARIIIVCSLAGGTGSGTFLQIARYVRELIAEINPQTEILVRGMFVMPSVASKFNTKTDELPRMMANGYASLKELNAMLLPPSDDRLDVQLEYRPNQLQDAQGNVDLSVPVSPPIYNFCFLLEAKNQRGEGLEALAHYDAQVLDALHLQLFSPISAQNFSHEDNVLSQFVGHNAMARFCGAGVARLEYPQTDLVHCFAQQSLVNVLSEDWLELDNRYQDMYEDWQKSGQLGRMPSRRETYLRQLHVEGTREHTRPFWRSAWHSLHNLDDRGRPQQLKVELFLTAVSARITTLVEEWETIAVRRKAVLGWVDMKNSTPNHIAQVIQTTEHGLIYLEDAIRGSVLDISKTALDDVIYRAQRQRTGDAEESLWTWLGGGKSGDALHPVAVRGFLYRLLDTLESKVRSLDTELKGRAAQDGLQAVIGLEQQIADYAEIFDDLDTEVKETALMRFNQIQERGLFKRLFASGDSIHSFAEDYALKSQTQAQHLNRFAQLSVERAVYRRLLSFVEMLSGVWEQAFDVLASKLEPLRREAAHAMRSHDEQTDPTRVYVLASRECKRALLREIQSQIDHQNGREFNDAVYAYLLQVIEADRCSNNNLVADATALLNSVLSWLKTRIGGLDSLKMNVVEALQAEARLLGIDPQVHLEQKLSSQTALATPFIGVPSDTASYYAIWGMHPDSAQSLGARKDRLPDTTYVDEGFSQQIILRYQALYNVKAEHLLDFTDGNAPGTLKPGPSYNAYHQYIRNVDVMSSRDITPHLDCRWHLPAYLPDLNSKTAKRVLADIESAFLCGLLLGIFLPVTDRGGQVWLSKMGNRTELVRAAAVPVKAELHLLFDALKRNPAIVDEVLLTWRETVSTQISRYKSISDAQLYLDLTGKIVWDSSCLLNAILLLANPADARVHRGKTEQALVSRMLELILGLYLSFEKCRPTELSVNACNSLRNLLGNLYTNAQNMPKVGTVLRGQLDGLRTALESRLPH